MASCRSLIDFCRAFEPNRLRTSSPPPRHSDRLWSRLKGAFALCEQSGTAVLDIVALFSALVACGCLVSPYFFKSFCYEAFDLILSALFVIGQIIRQIPSVYILCAVFGFALALGSLEVYQSSSRKCWNPHCRGLRKAVEFDIQLESEEVAKANPSIHLHNHHNHHHQDGSENLPSKVAEHWEEHLELEAELRRMAPLNGRAVLICRKPCGCPTARMEVWGNKKPRKTRK